MPEYKEPLAFFVPEIGKRELKSLCRRSDAGGLIYFLGWLVGCVVSGTWVVLSMHTLWLLPALLVHGAMLSFSYAASHECAHGTAFKSRWLNETVFWVTSLVFGEEPVYRRYSHTSHHSFTWFRNLDAQMPYHNPLRFSQYLIHTSGVLFLWESLSLLVAHSFGRVSLKVKEFVPELEISKMRVNSIVFLLIYTYVIVAIILFDTLLPLFLFFIPRILGGWLVNLYVNTQHMGMQEGVADHRYTTRSIRCNGLSSWLYWNMNFHIEHHIFPMVPFHALPKLSRRISSELPENEKGVLSANLEILKLILRQRADRHAIAEPKFRTPLGVQNLREAANGARNE